MAYVYRGVDPSNPGGSAAGRDRGSDRTAEASADARTAGASADDRADDRADARADARTAGRADARTAGRADARTAGRADARTADASATDRLGDRAGEMRGLVGTGHADANPGTARDASTPETARAAPTSPVAGRLRGWLNQLLPVMTVYLAGQAVAVGMLAWLSAVHGRPLLDRLTAWDGQHFLQIAAHGYTWSVAPGTLGSPAFLPGYPAAIAAVHLTTGLPLTAAALTLSVLSGIVFACAIPRLVRSVPGTDRTVELAAVALVAISPMSIVLAMSYSEALFCALASWSLVFALERRWLPAAICAFPAGLVRISGLALAAAFAAVAIADVIRARRPATTPQPNGIPVLPAIPGQPAIRDRPANLDRAAIPDRAAMPDRAAIPEQARIPGRAATPGPPATREPSTVISAVRPALAAIAAAAGTAGWIVGSGLHMGAPTAWLHAQGAGWNSRWDFGRTTAEFVVHMLTAAPNLFEVATAFVLLIAVVLLVFAVRQGQPLLLVAYGIAAVAEVVGSSGIMNARIRLLIPAFTILFPVAAWLGRLHRGALVTVLAVLALAGSWLGAYGLAIWPYAI